MQVDQSTLSVLSAAICEGRALTLVGQLDRKSYEAANKVLTAAGGKWDKRAKAHLFEEDAADAIDPILLTGEYHRTKQDFGQFDTPEDVALDVIRRAAVQPGMSILEPSAGIGNLVDLAERAGGRVEAFEVDAKRLQACQDRCILAGGIRLSDFLRSDPAPTFDRVVMNPPFARQSDIAHVMHAAKFLKLGGRLVSVMSSGVAFREDRKATDFRAFLSANGGQIDPLPSGSFKAAGTSVNTVIVSFDAA